MNKKGQTWAWLAIILTSPAFLIFAGVMVILLVLGFAFLWKYLLAFLLVIGGIVILAAGKMYGTKMALLPFGMVVIGILILFIPMASIAPGFEPGVPQTSLEVKIQEGLPTAEIIAPSTFKEFEVRIINNDPNLPLVLEGAGVMAVVMDCTDPNYANNQYCTAQVGSTITTGGFFELIYEAGRAFFDANRVGVSAEPPEDWGLLPTEKARYVIVRSYDLDDEDDVVVLWDPNTCMQKAYDPKICYQDPSKVGTGEGTAYISSEYSFGVVGYIYADEMAEAGKVYDLNVMVLSAQEPDNVLLWAFDQFKDFLLGESYTVVARSTEPILIEYPNTALLIVFLGIGILIGGLKISGLI